jgi:hypothetical protein
MGSAMLGALPPVYVSFEPGAPATASALLLTKIFAGYSELGSSSGFGVVSEILGALPLNVSFELEALAWFLVLQWKEVVAEDCGVAL